MENNVKNMATGKDAIKIFSQHTGSPGKAADLARQFGLTAHPDRQLSKQQIEKIVAKFEPAAAAKGIKLQKGGQGSYGFRQAVTKKFLTPTAPKEKKAAPTTFDILEKLRGRIKASAPELGPNNNPAEQQNKT